MRNSLEKVISPTPGHSLWFQRLVAYVWYDCIIFWYIVLVALLMNIFTKPPIPEIQKIKKRTGQVAVITGGPRGLALGLIKRLVQLDYTIIMGVRNIEDSQNRLKKFASANKSLKFNKIHFLEMDLMSLESVRKFAEALLGQTDRVDVLICNAAILLAPYELTVDGYESQFQVNYLSHFLLTEILLERLKKTAQTKGAPCQVIYTSSCFSKYAKFNYAELEKPLWLYTPAKFYRPTKLYPVMSMIYLQRRLEKENAQVYLYAVHPGAILTDIVDDAGFLIRKFLRAMSLFMRSVENGGDTILWPILSHEFLNVGGIYMESGKPVRVSTEAENKTNQKILYNRSLQLAGISKC